MSNFFPAVLLAAIALTGCENDKSEYRTYNVNSETSAAEWKGSAPDHFHVGSFEVQGDIKVAEDGFVKEGKFIIPIASIKNFDLPDGVKQQLLDHLKSPDFFNMALHPNAAFEITKTEAYRGQGSIANANTLVTGNFTMIGQTHSITFPAKITSVGDSLKVASTFKIDRTKWGMAKYNDPSAAEYLLPDADITLNVQAARR